MRGVPSNLQVLPEMPNNPGIRKAIMGTVPHLTQPRRWADPKGTSGHTSIPESTLATWRCTDPKRIPFHRIGRKVMYDLNEVDAALAGNSINGEG